MIEISNTVGFKLRCLGLINRKIDLNAEAIYPFFLTNRNTNIDIARCWTTNSSRTTLGVFNVGSESSKILASNISSKYDSEFTPSSSDGVLFKGVHSGSGNPGDGSTGIDDYYPISYGYQIHDGFKSDTSGFIVCLLRTPSDVYSNIISSSGSFFFNRSGLLDMDSGSTITFEQSYFSRGHVAFPGTYTAAIGAASWNADEWVGIDIDFQFDIMDGNGWNGTWLDFRTTTNLIEITGSHEFDIDNVSGTFNVGDSLSWGSAGTAGTGIVHSVTASHLDLILTSGVIPVNDMTITDGDTSATCDVNGTVTASSVTVDGIKFKFRLTATANQTGMSMLILDSTTTIEDQANNLYPIDQSYVTLKVTAKDSIDYSLLENVRVRVFADSGGSLAEGTTILTGLTNSSGVITTDEFLYSSNQPVICDVRRATSSYGQLYKPTTLFGTINSNGLELTAVMARDGN